MPPRPDLRAAIAGAKGTLSAPGAAVALTALAGGYPLSAAPESLAGAGVLLRTSDQLHAALALVALDGVAARIAVVPPDLRAEHLAGVAARAQLDTLVTDDGASAGAPSGLRRVVVSRAGLSSAPVEVPAADADSQWLLFTSGTTGVPKMVAHTLAALTGAIAPGVAPEGTVWGTFYDIRRYGGLQILLRALVGGAGLVLSDAGEAVGDFLTRLGRAGVTHLTGTPSHWRRALMSPAIARIAPRYVRLSGEIADQTVLDALKARFPGAGLGHAYASTEAGVGFEVTDGLEGFPAAFVGRAGPVDMRVVDGVLRLRSPRAASGYVGYDLALKDDGWVDTGDMVERRGERYYFTGRREGIVNVGGLKVHPEEVEAVINRHPAVRLSRVSGRRSPITGAIVVAEIVTAEEAGGGGALCEEILTLCRAALPAHKVPAMVRTVPALALTGSGKLVRHA